MASPLSLPSHFIFPRVQGVIVSSRVAAWGSEWVVSRALQEGN